MFRAVEKAHGRLDVLVNNAGLNVRGDFRHLSDADWVTIREVNLDGVVRVARDGFALLQGLRPRLAHQHRLDHGAPRPAPAHRLLRHQGRGHGADARPRRGVRAVRHPRERAVPGLRRDGADARACSGIRHIEKALVDSTALQALSASPRRSPRRRCSSPATTPPTSPAPSSPSTAAWRRGCEHCHPGYSRSEYPGPEGQHDARRLRASGSRKSRLSAKYPG